MDNIGLVEHCKKALEEKWGYVWGTFGNVLTQKAFNDKLAQYPEQVGRYKDYIQARLIGRRTVDCNGLIKSYMWTGDGGIRYDPRSDINTEQAFDKAPNKGDIGTLKECPGTVLYRKGHVGVYIGGGEAIEARGTEYGVVLTKIADRGWTHWLEYPGLLYVRDTFADTSGHWGRDIIEQAFGMGLVTGYPDGTFRPDAPLTRAEGVALVLAAIEKKQ